MHGISSQYVDGLEIRIKELEARIAELEKPVPGGEFERVANQCTSDTRSLSPDGKLPKARVRYYISLLTAAHTADMRVAEEKNREKVRELVSELEYLLSSQPWPDEKRARKCIAKYKEGK